jgi:PleD family two-component response regulator
VLLPETPPERTVEAIEHALQKVSPAAVPSASPHLLPEAIDDDRNTLQPGQTTILVIEDDPAFTRILIDMIHRKGYRALAANNGEAGLQLAREHRPTGILLDVMLPMMDGWTVMDQLKADAHASDSRAFHFRHRRSDARARTGGGWLSHQAGEPRIDQHGVRTTAAFRRRAPASSVDRR